MNVVLLLTGCIVPNCNDCLKVKDIETRKQMYLESISWYLSNTPYDIVFCENSGTDISIHFPNEQRLEVLTFTASNNPNEDQSKSSKELSIIKYAYDNSEKIAPGHIFVKITGRLKYLNIVETLNNIEVPTDYKSEFVCCDIGKTNIWSDSRCFFFTYPFFERMFEKKHLVNMSFEFERLLGACVYQMRMNRTGIFYFLPLPQRISGVGGGFGITYDISDSQYRRNIRKHRLIKLLFDLGILPRFKRDQINLYGSR